MHKIHEVMTHDPVCCLPEDMVKDAAMLMKSGNVGSIPVIQDSKTRRLVGIVTDRDLAVKVVAGGLDPASTKVQSVMTRDLVTCHSDEDLENALDAMSKRQVRRIPIVDKDGKILGIISQADVATRANHPLKTAEVVKEISQPKRN